MCTLINRFNCFGLNNVVNVKIWRMNSSLADKSVTNDEEEEFRVLDILRKKQTIQRKAIRKQIVHPDRAERMPVDQYWGDVWPGPKTFHPSSVPLPIRQGYVTKGMAPPGKKANAELMKIPNFLHLTPPVIKSQCEALKQFCTEWPSLLDTKESIEKHYPIEIITSDYCHASPTIRNPLARVVTLRVKVTDLNLDEHAKDKFLRLVGEKYNKETDVVTLTADRCPMRKQNLDYANYLLTACYHESWNYEDWESEKSEVDMEYYDWDKNSSKRSIVDWYLKTQGETKELSNEDYKNFDIKAIPNGDEYKNAVSKYFNDGESEETVNNYAEAVRKVLGLPDKKYVP